MKKITFLLTILSALSMTACDKANDQAAAEKPAIEAPAVETPVADAAAVATTENNTAIENAAGLSETPATPEAEAPAEAAK